jgi:hypothetical protein
MKTIPKNVKHAFLISSYMGSVLKYHKEGRPKLLALHNSIDNGMRRYAIVGGSRAYYEISSQGAKIWEKLNEKHHTTLDYSETEIFVEMLGGLMNPKNHKDFLGLSHFITTHETSKEKYAAMCKSVLDLNDEVNKLLATNSQGYPLIKPKIEKVKKPKEKSKAQKIHEQNVLEEKVRQDRVTKTLRDMIARAKG